MDEALRDRIEGLAQARDFDGLENLFLEAAESAPADTEVLLCIADTAIAARQGERAGVLLEIALPHYLEHGPPSDALALLRRAVAVQPGNAGYRQAYLDRFREVHPQTPGRDAFIRFVRLGQAPDPSRAMETLDRLMALDAGAYVEHPGGWGVGRVRDVRGEPAELVVDLERRRNHAIDCGAALSILRPIPPHHFSAVRFDRREELEGMARERPAHLVRLYLESFGSPRTFKEIRRALTGGIIEPASWGDWWTRARKALRADPWIRINASPASVELLEQPVSKEEEMASEFRRAGWPDRLRMIRRGLRQRLSPELRATFLGELEMVRGSGPPSRRIEAEIILADDRGEGPEAIDAILASTPDLARALSGLVLPEHRRRAMDRLGNAPGIDRGAILRDLFFGPVDTLRDMAGEELLASEAREDVLRALDEIAVHPSSNPAVFIWLVRRAASDPEMGRRFPPVAMAERLFLLLDTVGRAGSDEGREAVRSVRGLLSQKGYAYFRQVVAGLGDDLDAARRLYRMVIDARGLSDPMRIVLCERIIERFPEAATGKRTAASVLEDGFVYVTLAGLRRREDEFRELMEVKIPKNYEDVGRAREFGDLWENAEYTAALEEQRLLTEKAQAMKDELDRARVIDHGFLREGEVTLGSEVIVESLEGGPRRIFRLLGPWDTGSDAEVISYLTPFGRAFLGKRIGEEARVDLPKGEEYYRIVAISDGIGSDG